MATRRILPQTISEIPDGPAGIRATLSAMRRLAKDASRSPLIRQTAQSLTQNEASKNWVGEIARIHEFVRDQIRYVRDPRGMELVQDPPATLELRSGDCDDKCTLAAALLESIGHPCRFVAIGFAPGHYSHVFLETRVNRRKGGYHWIALECTEPWPLGRAPVGYVSRMTKDV